MTISMSATFGLAKFTRLIYFYVLTPCRHFWTYIHGLKLPFWTVNIMFILMQLLSEWWYLLKFIFQYIFMNSVLFWNTFITTIWNTYSKYGWYFNCDCNIWLSGYRFFIFYFVRVPKEPFGNVTQNKYRKCIYK